MRKHADPLDIAGDLTEEMNASAVQAITGRSRPTREEFCVDCETRIPEERQKATGGTDRCVYCQGVNE